MCVKYQSKSHCAAESWTLSVLLLPITFFTSPKVQFVEFSGIEWDQTWQILNIMFI